MVGFELDEPSKELRTITKPYDLGTWTKGLFNDHIQFVVKNVPKKLTENGIKCKQYCCTKVRYAF